MRLLFHPLLQKDDEEHGRHDEGKAFRIKGNEAPQEAADRGTRAPVQDI